MYCKACGKKIDFNSVFCSFCGTKQSELNKPTSSENELSVAKDISNIQNVTANSNAEKKESTWKNAENQKYDLTYQKETDATAIGILILIASFAGSFFFPDKFESRESQETTRSIASIIALLVRILVTIWVVRIARRQNRESFGWGILAFLLPSIALIIIGQLKKIFFQFDLNNSLSHEENSKALSQRAIAFLNDRKFIESVRFCEKAIELDPTNKLAIETLKKARVEMPDEYISDTVYRETKNNQLLKIVSKGKNTLGASVYIDETPAPNGEYYYSINNKKIIVNNGKLVELVYVHEYADITVDQKSEYSPSIDDKVFLKSGEVAPDGKYKTSFFDPSFEVKDGKVSKY